MGPSLERHSVSSYCVIDCITRNLLRGKARKHLLDSLGIHGPLFKVVIRFVYMPVQGMTAFFSQSLIAFFFVKRNCTGLSRNSIFRQDDTSGTDGNDLLCAHYTGAHDERNRNIKDHAKPATSLTGKPGSSGGPGRRSLRHVGDGSATEKLMHRRLHGVSAVGSQKSPADFAQDRLGSEQKDNATTRFCESAYDFNNRALARCRLWVETLNRRRNPTLRQI